MRLSSKFIAIAAICISFGVQAQTISPSPNGGTPGGAAGGDLSGTYPNPTVSKFNGGTAFGTAAGVNTGTSGATIPLLNAANTFSGANQFTTAQTITPLTDVISLTARRNSSSQTSKIQEWQSELNATLASISKTGSMVIAPDSGGNALTLTNGTLTASAPALTITSTWNNSGVTFTGIQATVTDTASAVGSLLMKLVTGATTEFSVRKDGVVSIALGGAIGIGGGLAGAANVSMNALDVYVANTGYLAWGGGEIRLYDDGAALLAQRNGTTAQAFRIYNTFTDASNYERASLNWTDTANTFTIRTANAGTGTARNIAVNPAGGVTSFTGVIQSNGVAFASLPSAVAGMHVYLTDGLAANCGDTTCTTWGTTVTGGGGALKLLIWYNGTNWTLVGK